MENIELSIDFLKSRRNAKWNIYDSDVLPAWVADMDFTVAEPIRRAVAKVTESFDFGYWTYGGGPAQNAVSVAFSERMKDRFDWDVDPDLVQPVADLLQGTFTPVMAFSEPGEGVILQTPAYPPFFDAINSTGRRLVPHVMRSDGSRYESDIGELEASLDEGTKLLILCHPHNPTGRVFERSELEQFLELAERNDLIVISDEIFCDLLFDGREHIPFATLSPEAKARTITINSATKSFNIPGLRCAVVHFGTQELRDRFHKRFPPRALGAPSVLGIEATIAAWRDSQPWLDEVTAYLDGNRHHLAKRLAEDLPAAKWHMPEATYIGWIDCSDMKLPTPAGQFFLEEARVGLNAGENFDPDCSGFVRLTFATSRAILDEMIDRMASAVNRRSK